MMDFDLISGWICGRMLASVPLSIGGEGGFLLDRTYHGIP